ncbi:MAG: DUF151 domain-containing protein [Bacteroidaceae bacterium]
MDKIELTVQDVSRGISYKEMYILLLREVNGLRKLPLMIGSAEAQTIVAKLHPGIQPPFLMADVLHSVTMRYNIDIDSIVIHKVEEGVFWAFTLFRRETEISGFELRASDAVCLALTYRIPLYVEKKLFERQYMREQGDGLVSLPINSLSLTLLQEALKAAVHDENFELASQLRDEIKRRK